MEPNAEKKSFLNLKNILGLVVLVVLIAFLVGWATGRKSDSEQPVTQPAGTSTPVANNNNDNDTDVSALVSYNLPDGWTEASCPDAQGSVFVVPQGAPEVDCSATPSAPVKISIDSANNTDCNQLQSVQNVSKHTCISEFINGKKSLKAETRFNDQSAYKQETTVRAYYIDTGKGVVKVEYVYKDADTYAAGWEELAKSVQVK